MNVLAGGSNKARTGTWGEKQRENEGRSFSRLGPGALRSCYPAPGRQRHTRHLIETQSVLSLKVWVGCKWQVLNLNLRWCSPAQVLARPGLWGERVSWSGKKPSEGFSEKHQRARGVYGFSSRCDVLALWLHCVSLKCPKGRFTPVMSAAIQSHSGTFIPVVT